MNEDKNYEIAKLFDRPKVIGCVGNTNEGKSNLLYWMINELKEKAKEPFKLYSYGLEADLGERKINTVGELELLKDAIVFLDEFYTLFELYNRKKTAEIEKIFRRINHPSSNIILVLCGLPQNYNKFVSEKLDCIILKQCTIKGFINGSTMKDKVVDYKGAELGSTILRMEKNEAIVFDGNHYVPIEIPYMIQFDTKRENPPIYVTKEDEDEKL